MSLQNERGFQKQPTIFVGKKRGISKAIAKDAKEGATAPKILRYWKQACDILRSARYEHSTK